MDMQISNESLQRAFISTKVPRRWQDAMYLIVIFLVVGRLVQRLKCLKRKSQSEARDIFESFTLRSKSTFSASGSCDSPGQYADGLQFGDAGNPGYIMKATHLVNFVVERRRKMDGSGLEITDQDFLIECGFRVNRIEQLMPPVMGQKWVEQAVHEGNA